jgi:hypothetical protein
MINRGNYEEYMMLLADGELSATETEELKTFAKGDKELEQELAYYMAARLVPDTTDIYTGKKELLKKTAPARVIGLQKSRAYGIAAGILLLIFLGIFKWLHKSTGLQELTKTDTIHQAPIQKPQTTQQKPQLSAPLAKQEVLSPTIPAPQKRVIVRTKTRKPINNIARLEKPKQDTRNSIAANTFEKINFDSIMNSLAEGSDYGGDREKKIRQIPGEQGKRPGLVKIDSSARIKYGWDPAGSEIAISSIEPKPKRNFFSRLPIVGKKNVGINIVTDAVENNIGKAKQIKHSLKNTDVVIKIGNKELLAFNL